MDSKKYTLKHPIEIGEEKTTEIELKMPTGKMLMEYPVRMSLKAEEMTSKHMCEYLLACGVPEMIVDRMTMKDIDYAMTECFDFFTG